MMSTSRWKLRTVSIRGDRDAVAGSLTVDPARQRRSLAVTRDRRDPTTAVPLLATGPAPGCEVWKRERQSRNGRPCASGTLPTTIMMPSMNDQMLPMPNVTIDTMSCAIPMLV